MISETVKRFIKENIDLIDAEDFDVLYEKMYEELDMWQGELTQVLLDARINPLPHMSCLPSHAFAEVQIPLDTLTIPSNIKRIEGLTFKSSNIEHLIIEEGCEVLDKYAFAQMRALKRIELPKTIVQMGFAMFTNCDALELIEFAGTFEDLHVAAGSDAIAYRWFGTPVLRTKTNCMLKCKDRMISLHL